MNKGFLLYLSTLLEVHTYIKGVFCVGEDNNDKGCEQVVEKLIRRRV